MSKFENLHKNNGVYGTFLPRTAWEKLSFRYIFCKLCRICSFIVKLIKLIK